MKFNISHIKSQLSLRTVILFGIIALGAFLRLYRIRDYLSFLGDEGRDVLVVYNILHGHLTLLGPTSSVGGFFLGPIYYYFMAPFLWLFRFDPVGPAIMIALVGILTIWILYKISSEFFNPIAGIFAAFFYAISPLVLTYSRSSWNPNLMPIFTLLTLYVLYKGTITHSKKLFILSGFLFGITMQLHYLATFVGVIIFAYVLIANLYDFKAKNNKNENFFIQLFKQYILFFVGFIVGFSPFLAFEIRHDMQNIKNIVAFIAQGKDTGGGGQFMPTIQDIFYRIFARLVADVPSPDLYSIYNHTVLFLWQLFATIIGIFSTLFLLWKLVENKKQREKFFQFLLLSLWFFLGIVLFGFYKRSIYDYYFEFMFTLPFFLVGGFFSFLWQRNSLLRVVVIVAVFVLAFLNLLYMPFRFEPNRQLNQTEVIARKVLQEANGKPFNFALITSGNSDHAYRYFFTIWGHPPVTIQYPGIDPQRKSVTDQLLIVCESIPCEPEGNSLWEVAGFGRAKIVGKWHVIVVDVYKLVHYYGK